MSISALRKEEESLGPNQVKGMVATIITLFLLLLFLFLMGLYYQEPPPEEQGVMMALGMPDAGMDSEQAASPEPTPSTPPPPSEQEEDNLTQDEEEAPAAEKEKTTKEKTKPSETTKKDPTPPKEETKPAERKADPSSLFQKRDKEGKGKGDEKKDGDKGEKDGDPDGEPDGGGLGKDGVKYSLSGRGISKGVTVNEKPDKEGIVVVAITVDRNGNVVRAKFQLKGSSTQDTKLIAIAERAALTAKFKANPDAPEEQVGSITFNFKLR